MSLLRILQTICIVKGNYAWYYKEPEKFLVTDKAVFIQVSNNDSLFLHADTISAITVSDIICNWLQTYESISWMQDLQ